MDTTYGDTLRSRQSPDHKRKAAKAVVVRKSDASYGRVGSSPTKATL